MYLFILFCYGLSILAEMSHMAARSDSRKQFFLKRLGIRGGTFLSSRTGVKVRKFAKAGFGLYLLACIAIGGVTTGMQTKQIFDMRACVRRSGWLENEDGKSDEDEWSSFGQLVPMFLGLLIIFKILEEICSKCRTSL